MKILQINIFGNLSTGNIAADIYRTIVAEGYEGKVAFARNSIAEDVPYIKIGTGLDVKIHAFMTRITDKAGFYSTKATKKLIGEIKEYDPDIVHLHNIHGYYINIEELFKYLKSVGIPVVWTLHDCWAFTGHCCHFDAIGCDKWKTGCHCCPQKGSYPASKLLDNSKWNYEKKKNLFLGLNNITIVTVSKWLESIVRQSFLQNYPIRSIYNGIDLNVFKPTHSNLRKKYGLENKFIILGVASTWCKNKGLNDFIELANKISDEYMIVLIGLNEIQRKNLPNNILGFARTNSVKELVEMYSTADVYFNASVEETFGMPTLEAIACGTPVIVYNATALPEIVNFDNGYIVKKNDIDAVQKTIEKISSNPLKKIPRPLDFDKSKQFKKYLELYKNLL